MSLPRAIRNCSKTREDTVIVRGGGEEVKGASVGRVDSAHAHAHARAHARTGEGWKRYETIANTGTYADTQGHGALRMGGVVDCDDHPKTLWAEWVCHLNILCAHAFPLSQASLIV